MLLLTAYGIKPEKAWDGYLSSNEHFDEEGFKDFTDYCEYRYKDDQLSINDNDYHKVTKKDIGELKDYIFNFTSWIQLKDKYKEWYHFDKQKIDTNDYYILIKNEDMSDKYHIYTIYYFDTDDYTLYYFHNKS